MILLLLIIILTGNFNNFLLYFSIIFIHELGHLTMGLIFGWKIDNISFYPYGGVTKFNEDINRPLKEELLILLMGPLTQIIYYLIIINFISLRNINIFRYYHYSILIFNLLPIYPLDGGKILNIFL